MRKETTQRKHIPRETVKIFYLIVRKDRKLLSAVIVNWPMRKRIGGLSWVRPMYGGK